MLGLLLLITGQVTTVTTFTSITGYYPVATAMSVDDALQYCTENYYSLAVVRNLEDKKRLVAAVDASGITGNMWIGLRDTAELSWLWSVGQTDLSTGVVLYQNWDSEPSSSHHCGLMNSNGKWVSDGCTATHPFVCNQGGGFVMVSTAMKWRDADDHCRGADGTLASAQNVEENQALHTFIQSSGVSLAWVGLFRDGRKWLDGNSTSSYRNWRSSQPNYDGDCVLYDPSSTRWYDRGCADKFMFCCMAVSPGLNKKTFKVKLRANPSLDLNAPSVRDAILKQLQERNETVNLQWVLQSDGLVFHKEKKKEAVPAPGCQKEF